MKLCPQSRTAGPVGLAQSHFACLVFELWYLCPPEPALLWNLALPTSGSLVPVFCRFLFLPSVYGSLISLSPEWTVLASGKLMTGQEWARVSKQIGGRPAGGLFRKTVSWTSGPCYEFNHWFVGRSWESVVQVSKETHFTFSLVLISLEHEIPAVINSMCIKGMWHIFT